MPMSPRAFEQLAERILRGVMSTTSGRERRHVHGCGTPERLLVGIELATGSAAFAGGLLLAVRPDGSLLQAQTSALAYSPFSNWRIPGLLLTALVGGGFLGTAWRHHRARPFARGLSMLAGAGLVVFEGFELAWIGPQPLEAVFALVGLSVFVL